jgi:hypothetical protein
MSHRLLTISVNMSTIVNSPLKIGLKVEREGAYYKIINFYRQQNSVNQYIIQSLSTGKNKRVLRHQVCDVEILRSDWLRSTGNFVVNHLNCLFVIKFILNLVNKTIFGILSHNFNHNFTFHLLIPNFTIFKIP